VLDKSIDVVILVSSIYAEDNYSDDVLLKTALEKHNYLVKIIAWDDENFNFKQARLVVIRSCWDFDQRVSQFFEKVAQIARTSLLVNNLEIMLAYRSKYYLQRLQALNIPIVPTEFATNLNDALVAMKKLSSNHFVIKPHISASGRDTYRINIRDKVAITTAVKSILKSGKDVVLQTYIESVETVGERSTIVIDGSIIYTMKKTPEEGNFLVHEHHGGAYKGVVISEQETAFVEKVIRTFKTPPAYMRIDYLFNTDGKPLLLEAELVEPNLYLSRSDKVLQALTATIIRCLIK